MFGVDEGANAALLLCLGDRLQCQGGFTRAFRAVDFDDAALRQAADAERDVQAERAGRNRLDLDDAVLPTELHDRSLAERPFDLGKCRFKCLAFIHRFVLYEPQRVLCHLVHL
ncbi:hypothetical protein D9M72_591950 [compost metagenome]